MPTLNMGKGGLEGGSVEKVAKQPSGLIAAMKNAGLVLWIMGATAVTDANGQQVAVATVPQQPEQGGPAIPWKENTTEEIPTAEAIIEILRNGKENIKRKFPNYNDAAFQQIVGWIGLRTVKPETLTALAEAFPVESEERKMIVNFSKTANTPKPVPALASPLDKKKLPPLNESPEEKEARQAREKEHKMATSSAKTLRSNILESKNWKPEPTNKLKFNVKPWRGVKFHGDGKDLELTHEAKINFTTIIAPWVYDITMPSNIDANAVALYLRSEQEKPVAMNGNLIPDGGPKCAANFSSGQKVRIQIPAICKVAQFQVTLSGSHKNFEMEDIQVEAINEGSLVVNK